MRHSNTGKSDPQSAPVKRGFFAAAGERLKRAMSGSRAETASAATLPATTTQAAEGAETEEVTTSVQARARELLTQDRAHKRGGSNAVVESDDGAKLEARARKTSPPPLPWQRTAAEANAADAAASTSTAESSTAALEATTGTQRIVARAARPAAKRPVRDSKSKAPTERLGAAKAALAQAQAKRAAETDSPAAGPGKSDSDVTEPEIILEFLDETPSELSVEALQPSAAGEAALQPAAPSTGRTTNVDLQVAATSGEHSAQAAPQPPAADAANANPESTELQPTAADAATPKDRPSKPPAAEPIRTLTIARVLARQGYYDRSLSIYDALLKESPDDAELRAEADRVRADQAGD